MYYNRRELSSVSELVIEEFKCADAECRTGHAGLHVNVRIPGYRNGIKCASNSLLSHPESGAKLMSHNQFPKFLKLGSLEWLGKKVSNHFGCWAVLNCQVAFLNLVGQEEVTNVNGTSSLT